MPMSMQERADVLDAYLKDRPGFVFTASQLKTATGQPKKFVGRALARTTAVAVYVPELRKTIYSARKK